VKRVPRAVVGAFLVVLAASPGSAAARSRDGVVGRWAAHLPAADAAGRIVVVAFKADLTADMTTEFLGKGAPLVERGRWVKQDQAVSLQLLGADGRPSGGPLVWRKHGTALRPESGQQERYGSVGLPLVRMGKADRTMRYEGLSAAPIMPGELFAECWTGLSFRVAGVPGGTSSPGDRAEAGRSPGEPALTEAEGYLEIRPGVATGDGEIALVVTRVVRTDPARRCAAKGP
jgi:uncharacterized lipoprotein NlpE involved in copper resistance